MREYTTWEKDMQKGRRQHNDFYLAHIEATMEDEPRANLYSCFMRLGDEVAWGPGYTGVVVRMDRDTVEVKTPLLGVELTGWFPVAKLRRVGESCWRYED